jgi:hypothetical protein
MIGTLQGASGAGGWDELEMGALLLELLEKVTDVEPDVGEDTVSVGLDVPDDVSTEGRPDVQAVATSARSSAIGATDRRVS